METLSRDKLMDGHLPDEPPGGRARRSVAGVLALRPPMAPNAVALGGGVAGPRRDGGGPYADEILIDDRLVPRDLRGRIAELIKQPIWQYGWQSSGRRDRFCFWHVHFAGGDGRSRRNCEAELILRLQFAPIIHLWQLLKAGPLAGHVPLRAYANAHTFGVEGYVHTDSTDEENYFTTIYYAHPVWHQNWAGETVFYARDQSDIIGSAYPKPGRVVMFRGAVPHCARPPSRDCAELRVTVVIKTMLAASARDVGIPPP